jgi:hypothetical protein
VANLEFVQFHPTALYPATGQAALISEAARGEGAVLITMDGEPVMGEHPLGSLATRDVDVRGVDMPYWTLFLPMPLGFLLVALEFLRYLIGPYSYYTYDLRQVRDDA